VLHKIVTAGGEFASFARAARMLDVLADVDVSGMQVARLTQEVGQELVAVRNDQAGRHRRRELPAAVETPVPIACVEMDGGRMHTRAADQPRGVHDPQWKETKVACLWRMQGPTFTADPQPDPPPCFVDPQRVPRLVREIKNRTAPHEPLPEPAAAVSSAPADAGASRERLWPPERVFRTCVASLEDVHAFGPYVAAEAQRRGFFQAPRQVFLGDGDHKNWTVHKLHFPDFTAVTDFVHVVGYVYLAAGAVTTSFAAQWEQYREWLIDCWQGRVARLLAELREWAARLGSPPDDTDETDPRCIVRRTITYLEHNQERMNYPEYRRQGLPVTSSLVESLIKQFNLRVKGSEKFWSRPGGAEAILQVKAALLSDDGRLQHHILHRPGRLHRRRPNRAALLC
jgi:hypothetical protein